ncbi:MAG: hypothetical protein JWR20_1926 [Marmoricola sp.]|nr:hypothetical protein [Marmoricola sp.]
MVTLTSEAHGSLDVARAWERYADPDLWSTWSPQIQRVERSTARLSPGMTGTVRAGLLPRPTLPVPFTVEEVDEARREWSWRAHLGPVTLHLDHGVVGRGTGSSTWLRISGPAVVVLPYLPVARLALGRLVSP